MAIQRNEVEISEGVLSTLGVVNSIVSVVKSIAYMRLKSVIPFTPVSDSFWISNPSAAE